VIVDFATVSNAQLNFIREQGFEQPDLSSCGLQYSALMFQPRIVALTFLFAAIFQSPLLFLILGTVLLLSAVIPAANPFELVYNLVSRTKLGRAPAPRRFAQGMAGTFGLAIAGCLSMNWAVAAIALQVAMAIAIGALLFAKFCFGSFIYHLFARLR
jgi:hypothetical protein